LKFANTLKAAGVPSQQAEAEAAAFAEVIQVNFRELTSKDDLKATEKDLRQEIAQLGKELRQETAQLGKDLRQEIAQLGKDLRQEIAQLGKDLRQEIKDVEQRVSAKIDTLAASTDVRFAKVYGELVLIRWMLGVLVGGVVALLIRSFMFRGPI
ncbi:MAG TPA: hypothetical protein VH092_24445, partial [Urbifossiella sp.]|nr:hypothetical protein [Urbifossiella sp.]